MKKMNKFIAVFAAVGMIVGTGAVFAAEIKAPVDIVSQLTGKSVEDLSKERVEGKSYGTIAKEAGKLDEFKSQMLENRKTLLDERVKEGTLTQKEADEIYNRMKENQASCDGTGKKGFGGGMGMGCGKGMGLGRGWNTTK